MVPPRLRLVFIPVAVLRGAEAQGADLFFHGSAFGVVERGEGREKEERNIDGPPPARSLPRPQPVTRHPGRESNRQPLGSQAGAQPTEPQRPGRIFNIEGHVCKGGRFHVFLSRLGASDFLPSLAELAGVRAAALLSAGGVGARPAEAWAQGAPPAGHCAMPGGVSSSSCLGCLRSG